MLNVWLILAALAMLAAWILREVRARRARLAMAAFRDGLRALAAGALDHRVEVAGATGLEDLAREFNRMAEGIERRHHELQLMREHHRATLEEKVRERTSELQKAYEELKKLDELKDSFLSSVSHELRTPLSSIRSFSEILLSYDGDGGTRREFLGIINQESERLTRLINDVLDISKIESGEMRWKAEPVSLADVCAMAIAPLTVLARNKRQSLVIAVPEDLPSVVADRDRLIQVIGNLVSNAIKFTGEGGTIRVTGEIPGEDEGGSPGMARMVISDDGIGIPREEIKNIFEKFKQVGDTLTCKPTGTGLGLPISREIIRNLGGTLWAESIPGKGSRFFLRLPLFAEPARSSAGADAPAARSLLSPRKGWVGVADDDAGTVGVLSELLSLRGYGVLTAFNGEDALRVVRDNDLELLILDLNMPRKSGWKVLEELRSEDRTRSLPVIVLTGMDAEMDRARALALGAVEFLEKGRGLERLTAEIDLLVQRSV